MFRRSVRGAAVLLCSFALVASASGGGAATSEGFRTPSGNIRCLLRSGSLECLILSGLKPAIRAAPCNVDSYYGIALRQRERARPYRACLGGVDGPLAVEGPVLAYGRSWRRGSLSCLSRFAGLTCQSLVGHGFFLSRASWRVY